MGVDKRNVMTQHGAIGIHVGACLNSHTDVTNVNFEHSRRIALRGHHTGQGTADTLIAGWAS